MLAECPRCGEPVPPRANFCPNCGAPLAVPEASERRIVTVVFVDLAGSTHLASTLDPERFREVLAGFHAMVSEEISWLGGVAEGFIGDAVLGVFGTPVAHDDDAVRAIRGAVAVRDRAERLGRHLGLPTAIRVRIGVNTGPVAVGTATDRNIVFGSEVNIGARLEQAAAPGEILVGPTSVELARSAVAFGEDREVEAKGLDRPIRARPVEGLLARAGDRHRIPIVDRRRELTLLEDTFERVAVRERAHLVTLLGEPGIGKSRVVGEFVERLPEGTLVLTGRSSPFEEEATFAPLAEMVWRQIGDDVDPTESAVAERLRTLVGGWVAGDEVEATTRRLGHTFGYGEEGTDENRYHAAEVRRGALTMFQGLAAGGPLVLVFEDLHRADPLMLDLLEQLVRDARRLPLLVVCVARWELLDDRPSWAGGLADAVTLWVEPLTMAHATRLAEEAGDLDEEAAERVAQHAGGNPYFVIEIASMLAREERSVPPAGPGPGRTGRLLPATVQAVVAARMDQLHPQARELVRRASVFPRGRFDEGELSLLVDPDPAWLAEAADEDLLVRDEERPGVWRFRSDAIRDVAYGSLAKRERQRLHLRVATKLSEPETEERYPRTIAFHLEHAARAALDLNPGDRSLAERAVDALAKAADLARRRIESRAAVDLYERALALAGPEEAWGEREAWFLSMMGESRYWLGEFDAAEDLFHRALATADGGDDVVAHAARFLADITLTIRGDDHLASALFERSLDAARRLDDARALGRTLLMSAWVPHARGRMADATVRFREALAVARAAEPRDAWTESRALSGLSSATGELGSEEDALAFALEALDVAEGARQGFTAAAAQEAAAAASRRLWRLDAAAAHADQAVRTLRELGARWELAGALGERGAVMRLLERLDEAETDLREAYVLCRDLRDRALVSWTAAELARTLAVRGDLAGAEQILSQPLAGIGPEEGGASSSLLMAGSFLAFLREDPEEGLARVLEAIDALGELELPNRLAAARWWAGSLFGAGSVGGDEALREARDLLQRNGWIHALRAPELVVAQV